MESVMGIGGKRDNTAQQKAAIQQVERVCDVRGCDAGQVGEYGGSVASGGELPKTAQEGDHRGCGEATGEDAPNHAGDWFGNSDRAISTLWLG